MVKYGSCRGLQQFIFSARQFSCLAFALTIFCLFTFAFCLGLEPAFAQATYTVRNLNDSGSGSLREAMQRADRDGQVSTITFNVGGTIKLRSHLPDLKEGNTSIDATKAPSPGITLDGSRITESTKGRGAIEINSSNNVVKGLTITGFGDNVDGVRMKWGASHNRIQENKIIDWGADEAISVARNSFSNWIIGNYISGRRGVRAILLMSDASATIYENTIVDTRGAVRISSSAGNTKAHVEKNLIENNLYGIYLTGKPEAHIVANIIRDGGHGIYLTDGTSVIIESNIIELNGSSGGGKRGVWLRGSATGVLINNLIRKNSSYGVLVEDKAVADLGGGFAQSLGLNVFRDNATKSGYDVVNRTSEWVFANFNEWDHSTLEGVRSLDTKGKVIVDKLSDSTSAGVASTDSNQTTLAVQTEPIENEPEPMCSCQYQ